MKIAVYNYRDFDEAQYFEKYSKEYNLELIKIREPQSVDNAHLAKGCDGVSIITQPTPKEIISAWNDVGVKHISTRTIGYDHIDLEAAKEFGMAVSNVTYSTGSVADYTVMLILMCLRRMKSIIKRAEGMDYSLPRNIGREMADMTIGVVGTGRIGTHVLKNLSGFGCKLLCFDPYENPTAKEIAEYTSYEDMIKRCDILTFHTPATESSFHMVNKNTIAQMKDGVIIINTARGSIIDTPAFIDALEAGKIGAAGLDVIENELGIFYGDYKYSIVKNREMAILKDFPNVLMLPHMAFYTENAISDMVQHSLEHIINNDGNVIAAR